MNTGKLLRVSTWLRDQKSFLICLDHVLPHGLEPNLVDVGTLLRRLVAGPADALVLHAGIATRFADLLAGRAPWIMKLTTNSYLAPDPEERVGIGSVRDAVALGASGVAVNLFVGSPFESTQLKTLSHAVSDGERWGMPVVVFASPLLGKRYDPESTAFAARMAAELGADVVKTEYTGDSATFAMVVAACPVPVLVEDSPLPLSPRGSLDTVVGAVSGGGAGVMFGERVAGGPESDELIRAIAHAIHGKAMVGQ